MYKSIRKKENVGMGHAPGSGPIHGSLSFSISYFN